MILRLCDYLAAALVHVTATPAQAALVSRLVASCALWAEAAGRLGAGSVCFEQAWWLSG
ncbi:hypothetical protein GCM10010191_91330 [Actinomadura vinacea]|uniref:Uncharacterized protein n=1 Tax=Actinomadura vinacea TaxID=115336 RepID=A0ABN3KEI9_9ACTN